MSETNSELRGRAMAAHPWWKFYGRDWRGDPNLRACSLAARGAWADMLTLMHEAEPYGHLVMNGKPIPVPVVARMISTDPDDLQAAIEELETNGVLSRDRRGVVYSRRMVRDFARMQEGMKWAEKRWDGHDPKPQKSGNEKRRAKGAPNRAPTGAPYGAPNGAPNGGAIGAPITQKPEARTQKLENMSSSENNRGELKRGDEIARPLAKALQKRAMSEWPPGLKNLQPIYDMIEEGISFENEILPMVERLTKRGTTFKGWSYLRKVILDERGAAPAEPEEVDWEERMAKARRHAMWPKEWGPLPHRPGCVVPAAVLQEDDGDGWKIVTGD